MNLNSTDLEKIVDNLIESPPSTQDEFLEKQKYLELALSEDQKAEVFLLCAEKESKIIHQYLYVEVALQNAKASQKDELQCQLSELKDKMQSAAKISMLASFVEDHKLRGNIRFVQNYLANGAE